MKIRCLCFIMLFLYLDRKLLFQDGNVLYLDGELLFSSIKQLNTNGKVLFQDCKGLYSNKKLLFFNGILLVLYKKVLFRSIKFSFLIIHVSCPNLIFNYSTKNTPDRVVVPYVILIE